MNALVDILIHTFFYIYKSVDTECVDNGVNTVFLKMG